MDEKTYNAIFEMLHAALRSKDEDERELAVDLAQMAVKYTEERASWNWLTLEERDARDGGRTKMHNRLIDCFNIFLRYEVTKGRQNIDMSIYDRKTIGDTANRLVCDLAIAQR